MPIEDVRTLCFSEDQALYQLNSIEEDDIAAIARKVYESLSAAD